MQTIKSQIFCGREFTGKDVFLIQEVVDSCDGISRTELPHTVCELLGWKRPNDKLKARECSDLLELFEFEGVWSFLRRNKKRSPIPTRSFLKPQAVTPAAP